MHYKGLHYKGAPGSPVHEGLYLVWHPLQKMQTGWQLVYSSLLALTAKRGHPN